MCIYVDPANQTYLHQTYEKNYNFAGTIFVDYENGRDFNDCNTLVYGHNMKNGSMFGHLKKFTEDEKLYNNDRYSSNSSPGPLNNVYVSLFTPVVYADMISYR